MNAGSKFNNTSRIRVEKLNHKHIPTMVTFSDGTMAIQHPIVYDLMLPLLAIPNDSNSPRDYMTVILD